MDEQKIYERSRQRERTHTQLERDPSRTPKSLLDELFDEFRGDSS